MKTVAIVQARMRSTRLPGKVMRKIGGRPMIELMFERLREARRIDEVVLATSTLEGDDPLAEHLARLGYRCWRGSEADVLKRFRDAAEFAGADVVVRLTADCPMIDPGLLDEVVIERERTGADYCSNIGSRRTYPDGLDVEVFTIAALRRADEEAAEKFEREHVTPYLRNSEQFFRTSIEDVEDHGELRWTVDEIADFDVVSRVFAHFAPDILFGWRSALALWKEKPEIFAGNAGIALNEGSRMSTGQKLWKRAKQVIPGGNMLLSKRAEMFLPDQWPAYFSRAKGCRVWDLDDNEYIDMSIMGIGTNILGYGHPEVDDAVMGVVRAGNMSTLNAPEEVYLAERLIEIHPWADMARFARTGGEACAIAVRIARAASGRDNVAFCGYHGWHDWYLAANLGDNTVLAGHLLPGLDPNGVPQDLRGSVLPFNYNRIDELEALVRDKSVGVIYMEVSRNKGPADGFLEKVRALATKANIVLVFDECTSGFRQTFGGLHQLYGVEPDLMTFGKAIGNGYAITGVIGRAEVMAAAQTSFISSTFWTERIGSVAALKTLEVMEREKSWELITAMGLQIRRRWQELADKHGLTITHWGLPALCGFTFAGPHANDYKTLITQEMLGRGYLAGNSVYVSIVHTQDVVDGFFENLDPVFGLIKECEDGRDVASLLKGPPAHVGFRRLN